MSGLIAKIKRKETPFYATLYDVLISVRSMSVPSIKFIHLPLYYISKYIKAFWQKFIHAVWVVPVFKSRCEGGKGLKIYNGMPWISNESMQIKLGDDVTIVGRGDFVAGHSGTGTPTIKVGDRTTIGFMCIFSISNWIMIGDDVLIATGCKFFDNDGHPMSASRRKRHEGVSNDDIMPIVIGNNVWIGLDSIILKGVAIGDNSIVAAGSIVTTDIPGNEVWGGRPAKYISRVPL